MNTAPTPPPAEQAPASTPAAATNGTPDDALAHRRRIVRAYLVAIAAGLVLDLVVVALAQGIGGPPARTAALIGSALALVISVPALIPARWGLGQGPATFAMFVMGTWLGKMIVMLILVSLVRRMDGLDMPWVGIALLVGGMVSLLIEAAMLLRQRPASTSV